MKFEAAARQNSTYTVTATREYRDLPANDLAYIPKSITENSRTLALDSVEWVAQSTVTMGYTAIPNSYRAIAIYVGTATRSIVTGYVASVDYTGEIAKEIPGDTVYRVSFIGAEIETAPEETEPDTVPDKDSGSNPIAIIIVGVVVVLLAGAAAFFFLRHNVKVYSIGDDGYHDLAAKDKIRMKDPAVDLTPLDGQSKSLCFRLEIDKLAAKRLNGTVVDVIFGSGKLQHKVAYEGNIYRIEADFNAGSIKAIY